MPRPTTFVGMTEGTTNPLRSFPMQKRKCPMDEHVEATILVGIYLGGTLRTYLANQVKTGSPSFARMARRNSPQPSLQIQCSTLQL